MLGIEINNLFLFFSCVNGPNFCAEIFSLLCCLRPLYFVVVNGFCSVFGGLLFFGGVYLFYERNVAHVKFSLVFKRFCCGDH